MPLTPLVSLVVPSRGGAARLSVLFDALRAQTRHDWEAVVVLDGDVDGSSAVVDRAAAELPVRYVAFDSNRGRSAALNAGFVGCRGDVLVRCDDDLVPGPDYVDRHASAHDGRSVGVVGLYRNVFPDTTYARVYGNRWDLQFRRDAYAVPPEATWRYWAGNVSVTRETWERVGPYDEAFRAYGWEDVDWGYRLTQLGIPVVLERSLETEHRIAATTTATRTQRAFYSGAARRRFEAKHHIVPADATPANLWERAVALVSAGLDEGRARQLGSLVDAGALVVPNRVAAKGVAMAIDAAARAGHRAGSTSGAI